MTLYGTATDIAVEQSTAFRYRAVFRLPPPFGGV